MLSDSARLSNPPRTLVGKLLAWRYQLVTALVVLTITACSEKVRLPDGVFAPQAPKQWELEAPARQMGDILLAPRAGYEITAKVLNKRHYRWDDLAAVAPWDFALGWGLLSDEAVLQPIKVAQGDRFMFWHLYDAQINIDLVNQSSANVHLIPADATVLGRLAAVPKGAIIRLSGELVDVHFLDQTMIPSSLSRFDTGPGACEILLVHNVTIIQPTLEAA